MFRIVVVVAALVLAGCADDGDGFEDAGPSETVPARAPAADLPPEVAAFLAQAEGAATTAFTARFEVLARLGGATTTVEVRSAPPAYAVRVGDVLVVDGPRPATCDLAAETCVGTVEEQRLTPFGINSRFWSSGPAAALSALAARPDAAVPVRTTRTEAGVALDCIAVPVEQAVTSTFCTTPEGVFGAVESPAARSVLTRYELGPPAGPVAPPFPIT